MKEKGRGGKSRKRKNAKKTVWISENRVGKHNPNHEEGSFLHEKC
jgi:hypothetical protein